MTADWAQRHSRSFAFGPFVLIPERQLLMRGEAPVRIGGRALDILTALVERPGQLVSKQELLSRVWPNTIVEEGNLKVNMAALRRALGDGPGAAKYIATVTRRGYRFIALVQTSESADRAGPDAATTGSQGCQPGQRASSAGRMRSTPLSAIWMSRDSIDRRRRRHRQNDSCDRGSPCGGTAHADGGAFIDLATVGDPQFVPTAIASALGLGMTGADPLSSVVYALRLRKRSCCSTIASTCFLPSLLPSIGLPATSMACDPHDEPRAPQNPRRACASAPRAGMRSQRGPTADEARKFPAVELFATRASERTGYQLTDADAPAAAEICRRLDGNALAIELAATQTAAFPPA